MRWSFCHLNLFIFGAGVIDGWKDIVSSWGNLPVSFSSLIAARFLVKAWGGEISQTNLKPGNGLSSGTGFKWQDEVRRTPQCLNIHRVFYRSSGVPEHTGSLLQHFRPRDHSKIAESTRHTPASPSKETWVSCPQVKTSCLSSFQSASAEYTPPSTMLHSWGPSFTSFDSALLTLNRGYIYIT